MKKILLLLLLTVGFFTSCNKDFDELNLDTKNPTDVPAGTLFAGATRQLSDAMANTNVNRNIFRLLAQQWAQCTYSDESNYDLSTRNIPQNFWNILYVDVLKNLGDSKVKVAAGTESAAVKKNRTACIDIMECYTYSILVNSFGNVPYSEAGDFTNVQPKYDDAAAIYSDLLTRLDKAVADINTAEGGFGGSDVLLGDDMSRWVTFANSLKLKLGMTMADADDAKARAAVSTAVAAGVIASSADNIAFAYESASPNTNPLWNELVQSGRKDFVGANTMIDKLIALNDPRLGLYYSNDAAGAYSGGIYGSNNNYPTYSKPSDAISNPSLENLFIDYSEVEFLLAEAVERTYITGSAEDHYNNAITASVEYWGGSAASAASYIATPSVAYSTANGNWKEKIGTQKWFAMYNRGYEAWTEWRRFDFPVLNIPADLTYADIPVRLTYPVQEQNLNQTSYAAGSAAIGGDLVSTKLFWDKF